MYGNDLLDQWAMQMREVYKNKQIHYHYGAHKRMNDFIMHPDEALLLVSREANNLTKLLTLLDKAPGNYKEDTLFIFDEVHGAGSSSFVDNLTGKISPYRYRLGLSATPEREYDEAGNDFLQNEIGEIIFKFSLEDAIRKGILCEFNYIPLNYELTEAEKQKKKKIIAAFSAKKEKGEPDDEKDMYTQLALVNKTAINKIDEFEQLISSRPELLQKCIIFVQTMEYGLKLQEVLIKYTDKYHTYYADDEKYNLVNFAEGKINCLLTFRSVDSYSNLVTGHTSHRILVGFQRRYTGRSVYLRIIGHHTLVHAIECEECTLWIPECTFFNTKFIAVYTLSTNHAIRLVCHLKSIYIKIVLYGIGYASGCRIQVDVCIWFFGKVVADNHLSCFPIIYCKLLCLR